MALRSFIKSLAPPLVLDLWHASRPLQSWEAAVAASDGYQDETLSSFKVARSALRRADGSLLATNMLYLTALAAGKPDLAITDFGGSTGDLGADFLNVFPQATYTVVENPTMVRMMQGRSKVQFSATVPARCDIFFSSGTLQYLEDPFDALERGFASAGHAAILARNSFCDVDLIRVQRTRLFNNGVGAIPDGYSNIGISYPHRTLREATIMEMAESHQLKCVARIEDASGVLSYRGMVYGQQLVFMRRNAAG
jgi:putative methyltransferase (TIGR04325 family)